MALSVTKVAIVMAMLIVPSLALSFTKLPLPPPALGPEALAFNFKNEGPFTGLTDGRILKYQKSGGSFVEYAYTSPNRSKICDGNTNPSAFGGICGRPLGMQFRKRTGELYVADVTFGLLVVSTKGGLAKQVASGAEGQPFKYMNALDIHQSAGIIYVTDASGRYNNSEFARILPANDSTGRLIKHDLNTNITTVLLRNLSFSNGLAINSDGSFALVSEFLGNRILKHWLKGKKANTTEVFMNIYKPDNIRRTAKGDKFWVAASQKTSNGTVPIALKVDSRGRVLVNIPIHKEYSSPITEVYEKDGALYMGSVTVDYIGKYHY